MVGGSLKLAKMMTKYYYSMLCC